MNLNPPRFNKSWLKDEAKMMNPLEPKCPLGLCTFKPRISLHLRPRCCAPPYYRWERCWSDAATHHFHPPLNAPAGKTAGTHLFINARNQILPTSGKKKKKSCWESL